MKIFLGIYFVFLSFYPFLTPNPKIERVIGFSPYINILGSFLEKKSHKFHRQEALIFADLVKMSIPKKIVVVGNSDQMYPFIGAYLLRYFGFGKVLHYHFKDSHKNAFYQKKLDRFLDSFLLVPFYENRGFSKDIPFEIDILVLDVEDAFENAKSVLEVFQKGLTKESVVWVRLNKKQMLSLDFSNFFEIPINSLEKDSHITVYKPIF